MVCLRQPEGIRIVEGSMIPESRDQGPGVVVGGVPLPPVDGRELGVLEHPDLVGQGPQSIERDL